jgi:pimeloyl-ACP methyl ester carboxylesterase
MALAQSPEAVARGITAFHSRPSRTDFLSAFPQPVIVVTGAEDTAPEPKISALQADTAPLGCLHVVAGSGHYVPLERPAELNAILRTFIDA